MSFLVFGGENGWIGQKMVALLKEQGKEVHVARARLEDRTAIIKDIEQYKPKYILNCAGVTGRPNVDWCEDHKQETIRANVIGTLNLCDVAFIHNINVTNFATGCIFEYDEKHPLGSGVGFLEDDTPNFTASFYSMSKGLVEKLLRFYPNVLTLRVRMPISDDLSPRNFITKISKYAKVVNIPNSMTVLYDLLPVAIDMTEKGVLGVINFTNPGVISHNEILDLYKQYIDPNFTYTNFSLEEQAKILKAGRSNNELDTTKFSSLYPNVPHIKVSIVGVFQRMAKNLNVNHAAK
jgi:dTDP-4-dehydrorhamnose reductase